MDRNMTRVYNRYSGLQTLLATCGQSGCKLLTVFTIIEEFTHKKLDLIDALHLCIENGWVNGSSFWVSDSTAILNYYTKKKWTRSELLPKLPSKILDNQYTEEVWERGGNHHRRRYIDTLVNSKTVSEGVLKGYYIYTVEV